MWGGGGGGGGGRKGDPQRHRKPHTENHRSALEKFMYFSNVAEALRCHKSEIYQTENRARTLRDHCNQTDEVE